ncbi:hypothetical protein [uncultured Mediterranean phage uvMED]|nr:hypothetical protein [uncultured Mediterranean phage uvMED]
MQNKEINIKIEKGIPLTRPNNPRKKRYVDIFLKMKFGDSVFFKDKKEYISFTTSFKDFMNRNTSVYPDHIVKIGENHRGEKTEYKTYLQYVYTRNVGNGYRVWLLDPVKEHSKRFGDGKDEFSNHFTTTLKN